MLTTMTPAKSGRVTISGRMGSQAWSTALDLSSATEGHGVSRIWARSKISAVEATRYVGAKEGDVDAQVLTVALEHHLVSRLTSLVAVDVTPSRPAGASLETQEMPTNLPQGWNFEKVFGEDRSHSSTEASMDQSALLKLAVADKPAAAPANGGVELPQTDAGTDLLFFMGLLSLLSGCVFLVIGVNRRGARR